MKSFICQRSTLWLKTSSFVLWWLFIEEKCHCSSLGCHWKDKHFQRQKSCKNGERECVSGIYGTDDSLRIISPRAPSSQWSSCCSHCSSVPPFPSFSCIIAAVSCSSSELTATRSTHLAPNGLSRYWKTASISSSCPDPPLHYIYSSSRLRVAALPCIFDFSLAQTHCPHWLCECVWACVGVCVLSLTDGRSTNRQQSLCTTVWHQHTWGRKTEKERTGWGRGSRGMRKKKRTKKEGAKENFVLPEKGGSNVKKDESDTWKRDNGKGTWKTKETKTKTRRQGGTYKEEKKGGEKKAKIIEVFYTKEGVQIRLSWEEMFLWGQASGCKRMEKVFCLSTCRLNVCGGQKCWNVSGLHVSHTSKVPPQIKLFYISPIHPLWSLHLSQTLERARAVREGVRGTAWSMLDDVQWRIISLPFFFVLHCRKIYNCDSASPSSCYQLHISWGFWQVNHSHTFNPMLNPICNKSKSLCPKLSLAESTCSSHVHYPQLL